MFRNENDYQKKFFITFTPLRSLDQQVLHEYDMIPTVSFLLSRKGDLCLVKATRRLNY